MAALCDAEGPASYDGAPAFRTPRKRCAIRQTRRARATRLGTVALHGEGYRLAVHPGLHGHKHTYHLVSSTVGNRYVRKPRVRSTTDRLGVAYAIYARSAAYATVRCRKCTESLQRFVTGDKFETFLTEESDRVESVMSTLGLV